MSGFMVSLLLLSCFANVFGDEDEALTGDALPLCDRDGGYYSGRSPHS